jgi:hypothetical protein
MRKYNIVGRIPRKSILTYTSDSSAWNQEPIARDSDLYNWFVQQCPKFKKMTACVVVHSTSSCVPMHADGLSRSVFLFPIVVRESMTFYTEHTSCKLKIGNMYRFNDYDEHGIDNPNCARMVMVSVSFE